MLPKILWSKKYSTAVCRTTEGDSLEVNGSSSQEIEEQAAALEEELNEMEQQAAELGQESLFQDTEQESLQQWQLEMAQHEREHGAGFSVRDLGERGVWSRRERGVGGGWRWG